VLRGASRRFFGPFTLRSAAPKRSKGSKGAFTKYVRNYFWSSDIVVKCTKAMLVCNFRAAQNSSRRRQGETAKDAGGGDRAVRKGVCVWYPRRVRKPIGKYWGAVFDETFKSKSHHFKSKAFNSKTSTNRKILGRRLWCNIQIRKPSFSSQKPSIQKQATTRKYWGDVFDVTFKSKSHHFQVKSHQFKNKQQHENIGATSSMLHSNPKAIIFKSKAINSKTSNNTKILGRRLWCYIQIQKPSFSSQ